MNRKRISAWKFISNFFATFSNGYSKFEFFGSALLAAGGLVLSIFGTIETCLIFGPWGLVCIPIGLIISFLGFYWKFGYQDI